MKKYVAAALLEETRNTDLLLGFQSLRNWTAQEMVEAVTISRKKWEVSCRQGVFVAKCRAYVTAKQMPPITAHDVAAGCRTSQGLDELYVLLWRVVTRDWERGPLWDAMLGALRARATEAGGAAERVAAEVRRHSFYSACLLVEMLGGKWSEECNAKLPKFDWPQRALTRDGFVAIPRWTYDIHTSRKSLIVANLTKIRPGEPLPANLELEWTGQLLGVLWRRKAWEQYGDDYRFRRWEEVQIPDDEWRVMLAADRFWYRRIWEKAESLEVAE